MKRWLFFKGATMMLLLAADFQPLFAQNTSPYWSLAGNSNASSTTSKLGTTNAINLRLFANNVERLHINYSNGYVGIGTTAPTYKLHVANTANAIYGYTTGTTSVGVWGKSPGKGVYGEGGAYGVYGTGTNGVWGNGASAGVRGWGRDFGAYDSSTNSGYGVYGVSNLNSVSGRSSTGVYGKGFYGVYGNGTYYGIYGEGGTVGVYGFTAYSAGYAVTGYATSSGYGGYFESFNSYGVVGITNNSSSYAGVFVGNVYSTGSYQGSDRKLKQNITDVTGGMDIINKLQPKYYEYRQDGNYKLMNLPQGMHYGLIAQDVEQVLPGLVKETQFDAGRVLPKAKATDGNPASSQEKGEVINFKALNYTELIPIMVKAMQELSKEKESMQLKLEAMEKELNELKVIVKGNNTVADLSSGSLEQNTPNPFNNATTIHYYIPYSISSARVVITDMSGKMIKSIALNSRGSGQLTLSSGLSAAGSYNYTLWMDGKQVDSKKMVINK